MKKSNFIVPVVIGLAALALLIPHWLLLELAKQNAIRKFSSLEGSALNCVPSASALNIPHLTNSSPFSVVRSSSGCVAGLPSSEFQKDGTRKTLLTNSNLTVTFIGSLDPTNFTLVEQSTDRTNVYDFVSSAYQATVTGISDQKSFTALHQYLALLLYKATVAPVGFEHSWLRFDRGDFNGFISGNLKNDGKVAIEIYLRQKDEFFTMMIRRKGNTGDMSDVYHILSELALKSEGG